MLGKEVEPGVLLEVPRETETHTLACLKVRRYNFVKSPSAPTKP
jgi:hypothetical protein